tara:strand:- start:2557 stop:3249 length:693 start_codon:yes stop_codon:yes gene_type:complete
MKILIIKSMNNNKFVSFNRFLSEGVNATMTLNHKKKDIYDLANKYNISGKSLAIPEQIHSSNVRWVENPGKYGGVDGLLTSNKGLILSLKVADCVPVYILDIQNQIIGLVHSGWRGTVSGIVTKTIKLMLKKKSNSNKIKIFLGPSIGQCCYEVGEEVAEKFQSESKTSLMNNKWKVDLKKEISSQLISLGIKKYNINRSKYCTYESPSYCSYRRDQHNSGRMFSFLQLI